MGSTWPAAIGGCLALAASVVAQGGRTQAPVSDRNPGQLLSVLEANQPASLPATPSGMTLEHIRYGDRLFHDKAGCVQCHGGEGEGMPDAGSPLTAGLHFVQPDWSAIQTLVRCGLDERTTRSSEEMPGRGVDANLTDEEVRHVAAYVWAISQTRGEPWSEGHRSHPRPDSHGDKGHRDAQQEVAATAGAAKPDETDGGHAEARSPLVGAIAAGCPAGSAPAPDTGHGSKH